MDEDDGFSFSPSSGPVDDHPQLLGGGVLSSIKGWGAAKVATGKLKEHGFDDATAKSLGGIAGKVAGKMDLADVAAMAKGRAPSGNALSGALGGLGSALGGKGLGGLAKGFGAGKPEGAAAAKPEGAAKGAGGEEEERWGIVECLIWVKEQIRDAASGGLGRIEDNGPIVSGSA